MTRIALDEHTAKRIAEAVEVGNDLTLQVWGFELVLTINEHGSITGYLNDTAD